MALAVGPAAACMLVLALVVLVCDGPPVVLFQPRVGRHGVVFHMPKFRTMYPVGDCRVKRVTRLGRFLRRHRLDELPQLLCVLAGTMSLVGPRPELPELASSHGPRHRRRLAARPGLTGLWQIRASRRKSIRDQVGYDLLYLDKARPCLDLWVLARTVPFAFGPKPWQI